MMRKVSRVVVVKRGGIDEGEDETDTEWEEWEDDDVEEDE